MALGALWLGTGCADFFPPLTTTTTTTGTTTGDYFYVANSSTDTLNGFSIGTGTLTAVSTSNYALTSGLAPTSVVVPRQNSIVYVGGNGAIQAFAIGTSGVLTALTSGGTTVSNGDVVSMATSPDGQWLLALVSTGTTAQILVYGINTSSGLLTQQGSATTVSFPTTAGKLTPGQIRIAPSAAYVAVCLGAAGDAFYSFNTAANYGTLTFLQNIAPTQNSSGYINSDNSLVFSPNSEYLFVGTTGSGNSFISTYPIGSLGVLGTGTTIASGNAPKSLEMDSTGTYLYAANFSDGTISGYKLASSALTLTGTFPASAGITALVRDKSDDYIVGVASTSGASGTADVTLYGFNAFSPGQLQEVAVSASGTDPAGSIAVGATH